jgi:hypothetical protein
MSVNSFENESVLKSIFEQIGFMNTGAGQRLHRGDLLLPGQLPLLPGHECA